MSRENVDIVRRLQPRPDVDLAALLRDDAAFSSLVEAVGPLFEPDFEVTLSGVQVGRYCGLGGLRAAWLDWIEAWEGYRVEVEDILDAGDDVVVVVRDRGRRAGMTAAVTLRGASVWTVRAGKVVRIAFYPNREEALKAVGLSE